MKKLILVLICISILFNMGCKKDSSTAGPASLSATIDGTVWTANQVSGIASAKTAATSITAKNAAGEQLIVAFYSHDTGTITFKYNDAYSFGTYATTGDSYSTYNSNSPLGNVTISVFDKTQKIISGSFSFVGKNSSGDKKTITEGKFANVPYTTN